MWRAERLAAGVRHRSVLAGLVFSARAGVSAYAASVHLGGVKFIAAVMACLCLVASCSTERDAAPSAVADQTALDGCAVGADQVIDRLEGYLASLPDMSPEEFLELEEVPGLAGFQNDIAAAIAENTDQRSTLCNLDGLQSLLAERLPEVERDGVLAEYLVSIIGAGRELSTADVRVAPGDDVEEVLALLDDGSSITFEAGDYPLERPLLVQREIRFIGAGRDTTSLSSSSSDAALVVVGEGELTLEAMTIEHVGSEPASVVLSFDRPVQVSDARLAGGVADDEGGAGNGIVLSDETFGGLDRAARTMEQSVLANVVIEDNVGAGVAVSTSDAPIIDGSTLARNGICGVCFFGAAQGEVVGSMFDANAIGVQIGDTSAPLVSANEITASSIAGIVVVGSATPSVVDNVVVDSADVAIAIQDESAATVRGNSVEGAPVGLSILSRGATVVEANVINGVDVGVQVDEGATPDHRQNQIRGTTVAAIAIRADSGGTFANDTIEVADGIGFVVEGQASPLIEDPTVTGGVVAIAYTDDASGSLSGGSFTGQEIAIQIDGAATPTIEGAVLSGATSAGLVVRGDAAPIVASVRIEASGEVGLAVAEAARPEFRSLEIIGGATGASMVGTSAALLEDTTFEQLEVGVQVGESAEPRLVDNTFESIASAAIVYVDAGAGEAVGNDVRDPGVVAIQLGDDAAPSLIDNVLFASPPPEDSAPQEEPVEEVGEDEIDPDDVAEPEVAIDATVGILWAGSSAGVAQGNSIVGFVIGAQIGETASPELFSNTVDGGALDGVGFLFRDQATGAATDNETSRHAVGFQVGDDAAPDLENNRILSARNVAILVQNQASPRLTGNVCPAEIAGIGLLDDADPERSENDCIEVAGEREPDS